MHLLGEANWWFPRWLDRIVPNISIEAPHAQPVAVPAGLPTPEREAVGARP